MNVQKSCLAMRLLSAIAINLKTDPNVLASVFYPRNTSFLRLNYYPRCPKPVRPVGLDNPVEGHLGVNQHTDAGALTVLRQDEQPGLEVFRDQDWYRVEPRPDAFVVNIGDIVQVWSNDEYKAALHRVTGNFDACRYSAPFFFNPDYQADYSPLPAMTSGERPARYRPINWGEFRARRSAGDYADFGDEVQISHYRIREDRG